MLNTETTSTGTVKTWRTDYYYLDLLTLLVIEPNQELPFRSHCKSSTSLFKDADDLPRLRKQNFVEFLNVLKKLWSTSWESQRSTVQCYWSEAIFANGCQASLMLALTEHLKVSLSTYKAKASFNLFSKLIMSCTHLFPKSSKRICTPNEFMQEKLPTAPTRWNFVSRLSITVKEYTNELCEYLKNTIDDAEIWCTESVIKAWGSHLLSWYFVKILK